MPCRPSCWRPNRTTTTTRNPTQRLPTSIARRRHLRARTASPVAPDQQWQSRRHRRPPAASLGRLRRSAAPAGASLRAPGRRPRVRRVTRVLRHIDPWSTFKVALLFSLVGYVVTLTSGVLLWRVADSTGTLDNVERWFTQFGWETFELKGGEVFHNAWVIGLFGAIALTGGLVLLATLFNLVSDIVGGVRSRCSKKKWSNARSRRPAGTSSAPPSGGAATARSAAPDWTWTAIRTTLRSPPVRRTIRLTQRLTPRLTTRWRLERRRRLRFAPRQLRKRRRGR